MLFCHSNIIEHVKTFGPNSTNLETLDKKYETKAMGLQGKSDASKSLTFLFTSCFIPR